MNIKLFIDTDIIVIAHDDTHPDKRDRARMILADGLRNETAVISTQVLSEFYIAITKKMLRPLPPHEALRELRLLSTLEVVETTMVLMLQAAEISELHGISYWDAQILAAAQSAECMTVLSESMAPGRLYESVTVQNPFDGAFS